MPAKDGRRSEQPGLPYYPHKLRVGEYYIGRTINQGSFGKVAEGLHFPTGHKVAVKIINKAKSLKTPTSIKNLQREIRLQKMIKHQNIVPLYEAYETGSSYYLVMELCEGGDLLDQLIAKKKIEENQAKPYIRQIITAVEHLHKKGIVHRDIKLENILLDEDNNIKLVDFGLSNTIGYYGSCPQPLRTQCGTRAYAAPELLAGKPYDAKVDVWSIGVTIYAMLTGNFPYTTELDNGSNILKQLKEKQIAFPSDLSKGAVNFMKKLLQPDPRKRPSLKTLLKNKWLNDKSSI